MVTLVKGELESLDRPRVKIPEKALILYSGLIVIKVVGLCTQNISLSRHSQKARQTADWRAF